MLRRRTKPPKVFVDTNVWFSAFLSSKKPLVIIHAHINDHIEGTLSETVLSELVRNVQKKAPQNLTDLEKLLSNTPPTIVPKPATIDQVTEKYVHRKDQVIFQAAVNAKVAYFVTGNLKDFEAAPLKKNYGILVCSPARLVEELHLD